MGSRRTWVTVAAVAGIVALAIIVRGVRERSSIPAGASDPRSEESPFTLTSVPSHAEVYINNIFVGFTPHAYESFTRGPLSIRLQHPGLAPVETLLIVRDKGPLPVFPPFVFRVPVNLISIPQGAQPVVDGRPLRAYEAASFALGADDTVDVAFELDGRSRTAAARINPIEGLLQGSDTARWRWQPVSNQGPAELVGIFAQPVRISSVPPGADVYLDAQPLPVGRTSQSFDLPYGDHSVLLRLPPFDDYVATLQIGAGKPPGISARLQRTVWLAAVDATNPFSDLHADVLWIQQGEAYPVNPDDRVKTPGSVRLDGSVHRARFICPGFADTTVSISPLAAEVIVEMRPAISRRKPPPTVPAEEILAWVRFVVKAGRKSRVEGAEVFGIEKNSGRVVRYGPTDAKGEITTRVPVGDYEWWSAIKGYTGKPNGERVKAGRKTKEITLKVKLRKP